MALNFQEDHEAFSLFIRQHQQLVFNTVLNMLQNHADAEEVTQDVFVEAYRVAASFKGESAVSTWLYRIAVHKSVDHLRRRRRKKRFAFVVQLFGQDNEPVHDPEEFVHPGLLAENREKASFLFKVIDRLPGKQKTAFVLSEVQHLSYKEIGEVMETTVSSVESLLFRAKQNLRKWLKNYYEAEK